LYLFVILGRAKRQSRAAGLTRNYFKGDSETSSE